MPIRDDLPSSLAVDIGVLKNEQTRQRESIDRISGQLTELSPLGPAIKSLNESLQRQTDCSNSLAQTVTRLTVTVDGIQSDMQTIRAEQRDMERERRALVERQNSLELKHAAMLSRALPVLFGALGTLAATAAAVAAWWN